MVADLCTRFAAVRNRVKLVARAASECMYVRHVVIRGHIPVGDCLSVRTSVKCHCQSVGRSYRVTLACAISSAGNVVDRERRLRGSRVLGILLGIRTTFDAVVIVSREYSVIIESYCVRLHLSISNLHRCSRSRFCRKRSCSKKSQAWRKMLARSQTRVQQRSHMYGCLTACSDVDTLRNEH